VLVASATAAGASSVSVNNCFTSTYSAYVIVSNLTFSNGVAVSFKLRNAGADISANYYYANLKYPNSGIAVNDNGTNTSSTPLGYGLGNTAVPFTLNVVNPAIAEETSIYGAGVFVEVAATYFVNTQIMINHYANTAIDGFSIIGTGATGTVRVYGIRN
jgi:hypothetical protein